jgi:hypothetical protein
VSWENLNAWIFRDDSPWSKFFDPTDEMTSIENYAIKEYFTEFLRK